MDLGYKPTNERIQRIKKAENSGKKPDDMMLRSILDDKDIAPKQQPQPPAPQQNGAAAQSTPTTGAPQPSSAPAPETIPAYPDVAAPAPGGTDAPAHTEQPTAEQKPEAPTAGAADAAKPNAKDDLFEGKQERPEVTKVILTGDRLRKYFPDVSMTPRAIEESVYEALEERRQRQLKEQQRAAIFKKPGGPAR